MSQVDQIISDQDGTSFLADLNATLAAIFSQNSGATEPSTTTPYMFWADTANDILKQRNAADTGWIDLFTISTGKMFLASIADRVDSGEVTITAAATTGDIFAAAANSVLWDDTSGSITCTGFPAASKAGIIRNLRCNGATKFTAGANLIIEGIQSGTTITLADGALCKIRAITTTQFKMTYSLSGTFTMGCTGLTTSPTVTARYVIKNGIVNLTWNMISTGLTGISNSASFTLTGLPAQLQITTGVITMPLVGAIDNSNIYLNARPILQGGSSVITLTPHQISSSWTSSGGKGLYCSSLNWTMI